MTAAPKLISAQQYLLNEAKAKTRSEFVAGEVFAMVGTTLLHNLIAGNIYSALRSALIRKPCQVFMSDVKVHVDRADAYFYPDVVVHCGDGLDATASALSDAQLVVEVLSPGTEMMDRDVKLKAYRRLKSLKEYVLVSQRERYVEIYRREKDLGWKYLFFEARSTAKLESVGLELPLRTIYANTKLARIR